jgi:hypothetical protein
MQEEDVRQELNVQRQKESVREDSEIQEMNLDGDRKGAMNLYRSVGYKKT